MKLAAILYYYKQHIIEMKKLMLKIFLYQNKTIVYLTNYSSFI